MPTSGGYSAFVRTMKFICFLVGILLPSKGPSMNEGIREAPMTPDLLFEICWCVYCSWALAVFLHSHAEFKATPRLGSHNRSGI
jgi:hypothetical protein